MNLRLLQYFVAVYEAGTLHGAATQLRVAQPSLSRQIRSLEADLGFALFERLPRGLSPTPAGQAFLGVAKDLLSRADRANAAARAIAKGSVTDLTVVAASTTISDVIAPFVAYAPSGQMIGNALDASPEEVYATIARGDADLAIGTLAPPESYDSIIVGRAYVWAMVPTEHPLAARDHISVEELVQHPLAVMHRGHRAREALDVALAEAGLSVPIMLETSVPALAQGVAKGQRGIAVLSDDPLFGLQTVPITSSGHDLTITLYGVWDPGHYAATSIHRTLQEIVEFSQRSGVEILAETGGNFRGLAPVAGQLG